MKKLGRCDSCVPVISSYQSGEFLLDDEEAARIGEKKRRLSVEQVKTLERSFEAESKLEAERKVQLARELGLQPRQIAIWFQNRRARWKTKQLERDYVVLKANYDALKLSRGALQRENDLLLREITDLRSNLGEEHKDNDVSAKEILAEFKDGSSDSDSSAILQEENVSSRSFLPSSSATSHGLACSSSLIGIFQFMERDYRPQPVDECEFFEADESYGLFSEESGTMPWFCSDQWN